MAIEVNVTSFGQSLLVKALNNECPIMFTNMKFGNGDKPEDYHNMTDLVNPLVTCPISKIEKGENYVQITSNFSNNDVVDNFSLTEIGVFAMDQDGIQVEKTVESSGITDVSINSSDFAAKVAGNAGEYLFTYAGDEWMLGEIVILPEQFGMEITGSPSAGDTITVTMTIEASNLGTSLFAYVNQSEDPEPMYNSSSIKMKENSFSVLIIVDDAENVTASVKSLNFVTLAQFEDHIHDYNNPHKVSARAIGLGNVPNVTTNDQTPTFVKTNSLEELRSGETLSTLFGKIAKAVSELISHLNNKSNPHKVTAAQVGAATANHNHSASDFNSGTMPVNRGGTGKSEWVENAIVYADGPASLGQISPPDVPSLLAQQPTGSPYYISVTGLTFYSAGENEPDSRTMLWIDTTPETGGLKYFDGTKWSHVPVAYTE